MLRWERERGFCTTTFPDGAESSNWPWRDREPYLAVVRSLGFGTEPAELMRYCLEHEFCHSFVTMAMFGRASVVVWRSAHGQPNADASAAMEEYLVYLFQRFLHGFIAAPAPEWPAFAERARRLLAGAAA